MKEKRICPVCREFYTEAPSVSRVNDELICPTCGIGEALKASEQSHVPYEEVMLVVAYQRNPCVMLNMFDYIRHTEDNNDYAAVYRLWHYFGFTNAEILYLCFNGDKEAFYKALEGQK